jgi:hypothetical protein
MDNESAGTSLACRVTDFNVLPLGALIFLTAINSWHDAKFSIAALHRPDRFVSLCPTQSCQVTDRVDRRS